MPEHSEINEIIRRRIEGLNDSKGMKEFLYVVLGHELENMNMGTFNYTDYYLKMARKYSSGRPE